MFIFIIELCKINLFSETNMLKY